MPEPKVDPATLQWPTQQPANLLDSLEHFTRNMSWNGMPQQAAPSWGQG